MAFHIFTIHDCLWFCNKRGDEWVRLPHRSLVDRHGQKHYEKTLTFDEIFSQRFETAAVYALHELVSEMSPAEVEAQLKSSSGAQQREYAPLSLVRRRP